MFTDAVCPIHATYYPPDLDLKQHFPVRVILENFVPPAFLGSFPDCHGEEASVVIASFQAQFGLFF